MVRYLTERAPLRRRFSGCSANAPALFSCQYSPTAVLPAKCSCLCAGSRIDLRRTTYLTRMIQRWGKLPLLFLESLNLKEQRYALIGTEDWFMYPLLQPGTFVSIDETQRKVANTGWNNEFERPIYFFEHRQGFACGWGSLNGEQLILIPHPLSAAVRRSTNIPTDIDLIGQVSGDRYASGSGSATPYAALNSSNRAVKSAI